MERFGDRAQEAEGKFMCALFLYIHTKSLPMFYQFSKLIKSEKHRIAK